MSLEDSIPNNVDLSSDRRLLKALEKWQPAFKQWWLEMGPEGFQTADVYLRTAIDVKGEGWANFDYVKMPDYRWGIFLTPEEKQRCVGFGDLADQPSFDTVPGEFRGALRRIIVTQADTEPASVEQQRRLGSSAPSLYDLRNLFQVNVEEGRHLWAMVYLLHRYFGRDGREEADALLERRAGNEDKPRILQAFNNPCEDWLNFFCFTMFMDRDGKYQLASLAESGFSPLRRTTQFMLTEEAHHLFVGETGIGRIVRRSAELHRETGGDVRSAEAVPLEIIQKYITFWYTYSLDLFGGEISSNAADYFAAGLKGRYREEKDYQDHLALNDFKEIPVVENGRLTMRQVPLRNAMNEVLRDEYIKDSERALLKWNKIIREENVDFELRLPSRRFHRHIGEYAGLPFDFEGNLLDSEAAHQEELRRHLPTQEELDYVKSIMVPVLEPGKMAQWIAPPAKGINRQPLDFEYVRLN